MALGWLVLDLGVLSSRKELDMGIRSVAIVCLADTPDNMWGELLSLIWLDWIFYLEYLEAERYG